MNFVVGIIFLFLFRFTGACQSISVAKLEINKYEMHPVKFQFILHSNNTSERELRKHYLPVAQANAPRDSSCRHIREGVADMQYGFNDFFFVLADEDAHPPYTKVYDFSCRADSSFMATDIPEQIDRYSYSSNWELSFEQVELFAEDDVTTSDGELQFITPVTNGHHIPLINGHVWSRGKLVITSITSRRIVVSLKQNLTPGFDFIHHLSLLHTPYRLHQGEWQRFINEFGTHIYTKAEFGGRILLQVLYNSSSETTSVSHKSLAHLSDKFTANEAITFISSQPNLPILSKSIIIQGGLMNYDAPLHSWMSTLSMYPAIIGGTKNSLVSMMENLKFEKATVASFKDALQAEKHHHTLKKLYSSLGCIQRNSQMLQYLCRVVADELAFIVPNMNVLQMMKQIAEQADEIDRHAVFLETTAASEPYGVRTWTKIPVAVGVCTNLEIRVQGVKNSTWSLPAGYNCLNVFYAYNCTIKGFSTSSPKKLLTNVHQIASISLCKRW